MLIRGIDPSPFKKGDLLKISPRKGIVRFHRSNKLSPFYIGPLDITKYIGKAVYELALTADFKNVHNVFHLSMLKKYESDATLKVKP